MHVPCKLWIIDRIIITLSQCKILKTCYKSFQSDFLKVQQNCNLSHLVISSTLSFHLSSYCVLMETGSWPMDLMENFDLYFCFQHPTIYFVPAVGHQHCCRWGRVPSVFQGRAVCCWTWVSQCTSRTSVLQER